MQECRSSCLVVYFGCLFALVVCWGFFSPWEQKTKRQMVILIILGVLDPEIFLPCQNLGDKSDWKTMFCFISCYSSDLVILLSFSHWLLRPATKHSIAYCSFNPNKFFWDRLSFRAVVARSDRPWCLGKSKHCAVIPSLSIEGLAQQQTWLLSVYNVL